MNYRTVRLPIVTLSLIGINVLVYLVSLIFAVGTHGESNAWILKHLWLTPAHWHWYASITSMFVHAGIIHLLGNMVFLFLFGCCVEDMIGRGWFIAFYLVGGLVAELVFVAMSPDHFQTSLPMGGASGAISTCMGMYLLLRAQADIEFRWFFIFFFRYWGGEFSVPAWVIIPFWFLQNLFWAMLGMSATHAHGGVAFGDHVGGFLAGFAAIGLYKLIARPSPALEDDDEFEKAKVTSTGPIRVFPTIPVAMTPAPVITETPTIYLHDGATQSGPFTLTQVQAMLHAGSIVPGTQYWSDGLDAWQDVADLSDQPGG